jgi:hypothetical protein
MLENAVFWAELTENKTYKHAFYEDAYNKSHLDI